jgi:hypothetical protein
MANICEYFELNDSHLQISPLERLDVYKGMQFIENWFDPVFHCGGRLLLCGQNIRCYTT